jgi:cytochrome c-type biogenesis protein CcmH
MRSLSWAALALVAVAALAYGTVDDGPTRTTEDRVREIAGTIRCPACAGESAANRDAGAARAVRTEIADRLDQGQSGDEIRDYFASRYGDDILLNPPATGAGALVWIIPVVATVTAAGGLAFAFARWRRE